MLSSDIGFHTLPWHVFVLAKNVMETLFLDYGKNIYDKKIKLR